MELSTRSASTGQQSRGVSLITCAPWRHVPNPLITGPRYRRSGDTTVLKTLNLSMFDAVLDTDRCNARVNAELTLVLKLGFRQINPAGGAATGTYHDYGDATEPVRAIVPWDAASWTAWKQNLASSAERFWDKRFWLLNNLGVFPLKLPIGIFIPNFDCRLKVTCSDVNVGFHHHVIDVVRLASSERLFGSHASLFDSLDNQAIVNDVDSTGLPISQVPSAHEIGHLLGLGHVGIGSASCPATGDTNASQCYGVTDTDKNAVMGMGMQLRNGDAIPWLAALTLLIRAKPASTLYVPTARYTKSTEVYQQPVYPRTVQEFEAGLIPLTLAPGR